jgi:adenylylsulfate kinase
MEIKWHQASIEREHREKLLEQKGSVIWFTGFSASGKSTLANGVAERLHTMGKLTYTLDGDNIRHALNSDLGFLPDDREENIRRIGEVAHLFFEAGIIVLAAFISPYRRDRRNARNLLPKGRFIEVYCSCPIDECERRDPKGLYKKARNHTIDDFTGISAPYETPQNPEITVATDKKTPEECIEDIIEYIKQKQFI